ncbi:MAG: hypothetical protein ABIH80_02105 [Methanobacteriota archaeon]
MRIEKDKKDFAMVDETGTTPRLLARAVAKGEMTLEEAVEQHNGF